jgi:hypothetical protein
MPFGDEPQGSLIQLDILEMDPEADLSELAQLVTEGQQRIVAIVDVQIGVVLTGAAGAMARIAGDQAADAHMNVGGLQPFTGEVDAFCIHRPLIQFHLLVGETDQQAVTRLILRRLLLHLFPGGQHAPLGGLQPGQVIATDKIRHDDETFAVEFLDVVICQSAHISLV